MSEWSGSEERFDGTLRKIGIGLAAATLVLGIVAIGQRAFTVATQRLAPSLSHGASRELGGQTYVSSPATARFSPGSPLPAPHSAYTVPTRPLTPPPASAFAANDEVFTSEAERLRGQQALFDLRDAVDATRKSGGKTLWQSPPTASTGMPSTVRVGATISPGYNEASLPGPSDNTPGVTEQELSAQQQTARFAERINNEADGLAAQVALAAHPGRFPIAMRENVGEVQRELGIYLQTARLAAGAPPTERQRLQPLAEKHLSRSEEALHRLEAMVGGSGSTASN